MERSRRTSFDGQQKNVLVGVVFAVSPKSSEARQLLGEYDSLRSETNLERCAHRIGAFDIFAAASLLVREKLRWPRVGQNAQVAARLHRSFVKSSDLTVLWDDTIKAMLSCRYEYGDDCNNSRDT